VNPTNVQTDPKFRMSKGAFSLSHDRQLHVCLDELFPADDFAASNAELVGMTCLKGSGTTAGPAGGSFNSFGGVDFEADGIRR
jgi:hypothetical protein